VCCGLLVGGGHLVNIEPPKESTDLGQIVDGYDPSSMDEGKNIA
jgi:hypothetical protein